MSVRASAPLPNSVITQRLLHLAGCVPLPDAGRSIVDFLSTYYQAPPTKLDTASPSRHLYTLNYTRCLVIRLTVFVHQPLSSNFALQEADCAETAADLRVIIGRVFLVVIVLVR